MGASSTEVWLSLTVAQACQVTLQLNTCSTLSPEVTIDVFELGDIDCNAAHPAIGAGSVATGEKNCPQLFGTDDGAFVGFPHVGPGQTTYLIRVASTDGNPFTFPTNATPQITVQGSLLGSCGGDPHFKRWGHEVRDSFHGECDMVLFHNDEVQGETMDVHVRTTMKDSYSYVSGVAVKYGEDSIEFQHDALFVNGEKAEDAEHISFGDNSITLVDEAKRKFKVNVKNTVFVEVYSTKNFMAVSVEGVTSGMRKSTGILGEYGTGAMIARDGSEMSDFQDYGFEWQVAPSDPQIFMHAREPQLPYERCRMPSISAESRRRKLRGQDRKLYEAAFAACQENQIPENMQSCIDDVMFTGELELASI